jgi:hypothetical protein
MFGDNLDGATSVRFGAHSTDYLGSTSDYPDGDPYILAAFSTPGPAGSTVGITVVTHTGSAQLVKGGTFHYLASAPAPPRAVKVTLSGTEATVRWVAPASNGGSPVTSYTLVAISEGAAPIGGTFPPTTRSVVLRGLAAGRIYVIRVVASNATHGRGTWWSVGPYEISFASNGYRIAASSGSVAAFGSLTGLGGAAGSLGGSRVVAIAATPTGAGYWLATSNGTVYAFGDAPPFQYAHPASPVVGLAALPSGDGYWEITASGEVFAFGRARQFGPVDGGHKLSSPVTGISSTPDGRGYYVVTASGAVYAAGDASFAGTAVGRPGGRVVAVAANLDGLGYWLLTASGDVYSFNTIGFGAPRPGALSGTAVGLASTPDGHGYWVLTSAGGVYSFGDANYEGDPPPVAGGYVAIATN